LKRLPILTFVRRSSSLYLDIDKHQHTERLPYVNRLPHTSFMPPSASNCSYPAHPTHHSERSPVFDLRVRTRARIFWHFSVVFRNAPSKTSRFFKNWPVRDLENCLNGLDPWVRGPYDHYWPKVYLTFTGGCLKPFWGFPRLAPNHFHKIEFFSSSRRKDVTCIYEVLMPWLKFVQKEWSKMHTGPN
jgi:hypothetical protein